MVIDKSCHPLMACSTGRKLKTCELSSSVFHCIAVMQKCMCGLQQAALAAMCLQASMTGQLYGIPASKVAHFAPQQNPCTLGGLPDLHLHPSRSLSHSSIFSVGSRMSAMFAKNGMQG